MKSLIHLLLDRQMKTIDVDGDHRVAMHQHLFHQKPLLQALFYDIKWLLKDLNHQYFSGEGLEVELGSGAAPMRDIFPEVLATDIVASAHLDKVIDAENMDFPSVSIRALYAQNCFHHFSDPCRFFTELNRVLIPGGGVVLLEPYYGPFATFLFKRLFPTEGFDKKAVSWEHTFAGPMSGANQALSYIVFVRDRKKFQEQFPALQIVHMAIVPNYVKYVCSGGLNFKQLTPDCMSRSLLPWLQNMLMPLDRWLALHHVIVLKKTDQERSCES